MEEESTICATQEHHKEWYAVASWARRRVNFGWWMSAFAPLFVVAATAIVVWLLFARGLHLENMWIAAGCGGCVLLAAVVAASLSSLRFVRDEDALELLDESLGLHNRLSSARQGVGEWPSVPSTATADAARGKLKYTWTKTLRFFALGLSLILVGIVVPMHRVSDTTVAPTVKPLAVTKLEKLVEQLEERKVLNESSVLALKQKVEQLSNAPREEWFEHNSLEAAESLRESSGEAIRKLAQQLGEGSRQAKELSDAKERGQAPRAAELTKELAQTLKSLQSGTLQPSEELQRALKNAAKEDGMMLSPEQARQLAAQLGEGAEQLNEGQRQSEKGNGASSQKGSGQEKHHGTHSGTQQGKQGGDQGKGSGQVGGLSPGDGKGGKQGPDSGSGENGKEEGGGISRGPGTAPLNLLEKPPQITSDRSEGLPKKNDKNRDRPEEIVGLSARPPEASDPHSTGSGGDAADGGSGGLAVWKQNVTPDESEVLKRFYGEGKK